MTQYYFLQHTQRHFMGRMKVVHLVRLFISDKSNDEDSGRLLQANNPLEGSNDCFGKNSSW